jgi:hypothetical protein
LFEPNPTETLVLYGPQDTAVPAAFVACMMVEFPSVVGPNGVPGARRFVHREQAALFNRTLEWFCPDLLASR